jgi:hypothetical protein
MDCDAVAKIPIGIESGGRKQNLVHAAFLG